jgi:hypothetical protein
MGRVKGEGDLWVLDEGSPLFAAHLRDIKIGC